MSLEDYGWTSFSIHLAFEQHAGAGAGQQHARVIAEHRGAYRVITAAGERSAEPSGRLRHAGGLPAVGDWVVCPDAPAGALTILSVLPRRTKISRKVAGARTAEQVVAANVDTIFLVMGLDGDYNPRRIERFAAMAWDSGASPVVLLNKRDLVADAGGHVAEVELACPGVPVHATSCVDEDGLACLAPYLQPRETIAMLGSSGVGKSTLINRLVGREDLPTAEVRAGDQRGRHTTTARQLIRLPGGALLIDNPGMREIQLWSDGEGISRTFGEIEALAAQCRFSDCTHDREPGCAVAQAVEEGRLPAERVEAHRKLVREQRYLDTRHDEHARRTEDRRFGKIVKAFKRLKEQE